MNLKAQKEDAEAIVHNIMLGDTRLGSAPTDSEDTRLFLAAWTYKENLHTLYHTILRITLN